MMSYTGPKFQTGAIVLSKPMTGYQENRLLDLFTLMTFEKIQVWDFWRSITGDNLDRAYGPLLNCIRNLQPNMIIDLDASKKDNQVFDGALQTQRYKGPLEEIYYMAVFPPWRGADFCSDQMEKWRNCSLLAPFELHEIRNLVMP